MRILTWGPCAAVIVTSVLGALGVGIGSAMAVSTDTVVVTATINANVAIDATTSCAAAQKNVGAVAISALSATASPWCTVTFGASNTDRVQLAVVETGGLSATAFFERNGSDATNAVPDKAACGTMAGGVEEGGMRLAAFDVGPTGNNTAWPCNQNTTQYGPVPSTSVQACVGLGNPASTTAYSCSWGWAISMDAAPPLAGSYSGTVTFTGSAY